MRSGKRSQKRPKIVSAAFTDSCCEAIASDKATNGGVSGMSASVQGPTCLITVASRGSRRIKCRRAFW